MDNRLRWFIASIILRKFCSNLPSLDLLLSVRKLLKGVTIHLTKFTSVNLEDHNSQKATEGAIPTFTPFSKSLQKA